MSIPNKQTYFTKTHELFLSVKVMLHPDYEDIRIVVRRHKILRTALFDDFQPLVYRTLSPRVERLICEIERCSLKLVAKDARYVCKNDLPEQETKQGREERVSDTSKSRI